MTKVTITRMNPVPTWTTHTSGGYEVCCWRYGMLQDVKTDHDSNHTAMKKFAQRQQKKTMGLWKMYIFGFKYGVISSIYAKGYISLWT